MGRTRATLTILLPNNTNKITPATNSPRASRARRVNINKINPAVSSVRQKGSGISQNEMNFFNSNMH
jgi:hypothetical protein